MNTARILALSNGMALLGIFGIVAAFLIIGGWISKYGKGK